MKQLSKFKKTESGEIPEDWDSGRVSNTSILKGRIGWQGLTTAEYRKHGEFFLVTGTDFKSGRIDWENCVYVNEERYTQDENIQLKIHDVLVTKDGTIGKVAYIDTLPQPATLNSGIFVIRPIGNAYFPLFLYYVLCSDYFIKFLNRLKAGSTINHLYQKDFVNFNFPIPPYPEQEKIASTFLNIDELITNVDQVIRKTQGLKKGLIQNLMFKGIAHVKFKDSELGKIPEEWEIRKVADIAQLTMGQSPLGNSYNLINNGTPLLNGPTEFGDDHPTAVQFTTTPTKLCENGDILLCVRGSTTGRLNIADGIYCIGRGLASIRGLKEIAFTKWLYYHFIRLQSSIYNVASGGGSTFPNINREFIERITLPFPDISEQMKIASLLTSVDDYIKQNKKTKKCIQDLKIGLMQKLLTGKLRVRV